MSDDTHFDADYIIIGSGFGGSVSAMRLTEKGYKVLVIEAGRRWKAEDFPKTNWMFWKSMWLPAFMCRSIMRMTLLSDVLALSGAGVGGGHDRSGPGRGGWRPMGQPGPWYGTQRSQNRPTEVRRASKPRPFRT